MDVLFFLNAALLGVGLAMDAFSVSLADGLGEPGMSGRRMCLIAGVFALFQYAMPVIGWVFVRTAENAFSRFGALVPWIALFLLLFIGGKMLIEGLAARRALRAGAEPPSGSGLTGRVLVLQGVATSIDALSVGFTLADRNAIEANAAALVIGAVTFAVCVAGLCLGRKVGTRLSWGASVLGGCILICIGIEIFVKGLLG
jgi:putative Mn2+ efflux pump MntP